MELITIRVCVCVCVCVPREMPMDVSVIHIWAMLMMYNLLQYIIGYMRISNYISVLLNTILLLDYRAVLVFVNIVGWYLFLRRVKVEYSLKLTTIRRHAYAFTCLASSVVFLISAIPFWFKSAGLDMIAAAPMIHITK